MWESLLISPLKIMMESLKILITNKLLFTSILIFTTLPLSTLLISQSFSLHSRATQIYHLEMLARYSSTRFEARHVWQESRHDALSLLRIKALLFSLPSFLLSLSAAISSVHSSLSPSPSLRSAFYSISLSFKRPFLTSFFVYAILFVFSPLRIAFSAVPVSTGSARFILDAIYSSLEVYLMAVLSLGIVVSIAEDRFGWDAIRVGWGLMEGKRFCGWALSGLLVAASRVIGWKVEELLSEVVEPPEFLGLTELKGKEISNEKKAVLIGCYGIVMLLSYVVMSVYYSDCRRLHPIKEAVESDNHHELHSLSL